MKLLKICMAGLLLVPLTVSGLTFTWTPPTKDIGGNPTTLMEQAIKCGQVAGTYPNVIKMPPDKTTLVETTLTKDGANYCVYVATNKDGPAQTDELRFFVKAGAVTGLVPDVSGVILNVSQ